MLVAPDVFSQLDAEAVAEPSAERDRLTSEVAALAPHDLAGTASACDRYRERLLLISVALSARTAIKYPRGERTSGPDNDAALDARRAAGRLPLALALDPGRRAKTSRIACKVP
jgi:hypothetical protein